MVVVVVLAGLAAVVVVAVVVVGMVVHGCGSTWTGLPMLGKLGEHGQIPGHVPTSQQAH